MVLLLADKAGDTFEALYVTLLNVENPVKSRGSKPRFALFLPWTTYSSSAPKIGF